MSKFDKFFKHTVDIWSQHPEYREGQLVFNALVEFDPEAAIGISGTSLDPFYDAGNIFVLLCHLYKQWEGQ
jgi:hypothetical protein